MKAWGFSQERLLVPRTYSIDSNKNWGLKPYGVNSRTFGDENPYMGFRGKSEHTMLYRAKVCTDGHATPRIIGCYCNYKHLYTQNGNSAYNMLTHIRTHRQEADTAAVHNNQRNSEYMH